MTGVTAVSIETYSLILIKGSPQTLHGITTNFTKLVSVQSLQGMNFTTITNDDLALGLFAGKTVASDLQLRVGQSYLIYSTISESYVSLKLLGIESFNSFYDEELFTSLQNSNFFRPTSVQQDVSMIRIKYDPNILSKRTITDMVNGVHQVTMQFTKQNVNTSIANFKGIKVSVYTIDGFLESTGVTDQNGNVSFNLPLGHYTVLATNSISSSSYDMYVYKTTNINYKLPNYFSLGPLFLYSLTISSYLNGLEIHNASIKLIDYYNIQIPLKQVNGHLQGQNLYPQYYTAIGVLGSLREEHTLTLQGNTSITLNFTHEVQLKLFTTTKEELNQFSCQIYDENQGSTIYKQNCSNLFYLPKSVYNITFIEQNYGTTSIPLVINGTQGIQIIHATIGFIQTNFTFYTTSGVYYNTKPVYIRELTNNTFTLLGYTSNQGEISANFTYGSEHILYLNTSATHNAVYYKSLINENKTFILQTYKQLTIDVVNGSDNFKRPLVNANVTVSTLYNYKMSSLTSIAGLAVFLLPTEDILNVSLSQGPYAKNVLIYSFNSGELFTYSLGKTIIDLNLLTQANIPLSNTVVTLVTLTGNQTLQTDSKGKVIMNVNTLQNQSYIQNDGLIGAVANIKEDLNLDFLVTEFYVFVIHFNGTNYLELIPNTYFNSLVHESIIIPYRFIISFNLVDNLQFGVPNAVVTLSNAQGVQYSFSTNSVGTAITELYTVGIFSANIRTQGEIFSQTTSIMLNNTTYVLSLPIERSALQYVNSLGGNYYALSSKEYLDSFYNTTLTFFIEIALVLLLIVVIVLLFLFSSAIMLILESIQKEIAIAQIIGGSNEQLFSNVFTQLSLRGLIASVLGYFIGYVITMVIPNLNNVQLIGFIIQPSFNIPFFILSIVAINAISIVTLTRQIQKYNWKIPLENVRF